MNSIISSPQDKLKNSRGVVAEAPCSDGALGEQFWFNVYVDIFEDHLNFTCLLGSASHSSTSVEVLGNFYAYVRSKLLLLLITLSYQLLHRNLNQHIPDSMFHLYSYSDQHFLDLSQHYILLFLPLFNINICWLIS